MASVIEFGGTFPWLFDFEFALMHARAWWTLLISAAASALVWALSPWLSGHREPWDAGGFFYFAALLIAGLVAGSLAPRPLWAHYLGALLGQIGYEVLILRVGLLFVLGVFFLIGYSCVFLAGAALASPVRRRFWAG